MMTTIEIRPLTPGTPVRFPWGANWESALAEANRRNERRSADALDLWIPGLSGLITRDVTVVTPVTTDRRRLYDRDDLAADLYHLDALDSFRIYHDGELVETSPFLQRPHILHRPGILNASRILSSTRDGYTFNIGTIDRWHPRLNRIAADIERVIGGAAEVYSFVSSGSTAASPLHFDQPELLILPVEGRKYWDVRESAHEFAMGPEFVDVGEPPPAFDRVLEVGDGIVVPRGWLHKAAPVGDFSICLTFGMFRPFPARPVIDRIERSTADPEFRRPRYSGFREDGGVHELVTTVKRLGARAIDHDDIVGWCARELANLPTRNDGPPLWSLADIHEIPSATRLRNRIPGGFMAVGGAHDLMTFAAAGRTISVSADLEQVLTDLLSVDGESLEELAEKSPHPDGLMRLASHLMADGLLDVVPPTPETL